jgi:uncharacterized membrane protein YgaE (UPF0421/DUF939 family)
MNEIEQLKKEANKLAFNSVYQDEDNKYFRDILLRKMVELEIQNRRDERINQILEDGK